MAGGRKRARKQSGPVKSPTQSQTIKKFKERELLADASDGDSEYVDAESIDSSDDESVNTVSKKHG